MGSDRLKILIHKIETIITERLRGRASSSWARVYFTKPLQQVQISKHAADSYIDGQSSPLVRAPRVSLAKQVQLTAYFKNVHPAYPFLDRGEFTSRALSHDAASKTLEEATFSALYHAVLALGSQYVDGGTFQPGQGTTWNLFQTALGYVADVIVPKESLENLQVSSQFPRIRPSSFSYFLTRTGLTVDNE